MSAERSAHHVRNSSRDDKYEREHHSITYWITGPGGIITNIRHGLLSGPSRRKWLIRGVIITAVVLFLSPYYRPDPTTLQRPSNGNADPSRLSSMPLSFLAPQDGTLDRIDPLIGTAGAGHVFPGATVPFGMVKAGPDVTGQRYAGFSFDGGPVSGFSHTHDSGIDSAPSLGNFPIFVHRACPGGVTSRCKMDKQGRAAEYVRESVHASPGYFAMTLSSGVTAEMTTTTRAALYQFSFAPGDDSANPLIIMDASDLNETPGKRKLQVDSKTGRLTGEGLFLPSYGQGTYRAHVCTDIRILTPNGGIKHADIREYGTYDGSFHAGQMRTEGQGATSKKHAAYLRLQALAQDEKLLVRVGISWLSTQRACQNAEQIQDWDFKRVVADARTAWESRLAPLTVRDEYKVDRGLLRMFWSGIYRSFISPQDYSDEDQLRPGSPEPYYDSWYCIRDTFRGVHPLITLIDPRSQIRMVRSLLETFRREGWLPECRMAFSKGWVQGGTNVDNLLADSFLKLGKVPEIDWQLAYEALLKNSEQEPRRWEVQGRGGVEFWMSIGYIPFQAGVDGGFNTRSISRTLEYAYNDHAVATLALAQRSIGNYTRLFQRAGNWKNIFKPQGDSLGIKGPFPQPRYADVIHWHYQDPTQCSSLKDPDACQQIRTAPETYRGSSWLYSFYTPGDMAGLIALMGGREAFVTRLDKLHDSVVLDISNPVAFLVPFLYHYAGQPSTSARRIHEYIPKFFSDKQNGMPGTDGSGALGAFIAFCMLGLIPVAGQDVYLVNSPFLPGWSIKNPLTGKTATVKVDNFDSGYTNKYIQSATYNGHPYSKNWIDHSFFRDGGTLDIVMGPSPSIWGTGEKDLPPSLSTTGIHISEMP